MKSMPVTGSHAGTGFPPPPPNPLAFANPPVVSAPAAAIPNGMGIPQTPHGAAYLYQHQIAALAAKAGAAPYMPPVIYYPYPIPVSQQTAPAPAGVPPARGPQPNIIRNSPSNYPPNMATSANDVFYPPQMHAPPPPPTQQLPVIPSSAGQLPVPVTSTKEETTIQIEQEKPTPVVSEAAEKTNAKTVAPILETLEPPPPPPAPKKEVASEEKIKPSDKVIY